MTDVARLSVLVSGRVQGVGFRYWLRERAVELGVVGSATNLRDGRVEMVAEGPRAAVEAMLAALTDDAAPGAVTDVVESWSDPRGETTTFRVR